MANGIKIANTLSESDTECFIPHQEIFDLLEETRNPDPAEVRDILAKAMNKNVCFHVKQPLFLTQKILNWWRKYSKQRRS